LLEKRVEVMKKEASIRELEYIFDKMDKRIIHLSGDVFDARFIFTENFIPDNFVDLCWTFCQITDEN
jgi:hypothetical protein